MVIETNGISEQDFLNIPETIERWSCYCGIIIFTSNNS